MNLLLICIGGGLGSIVRYFLSLVFRQKAFSLPFATPILLINLLGAFGLGYFSSFQDPQTSNDSVKLLSDVVSIGFFGAFTTFSTFSMEALELIQKKRWQALSIYVGITISGSIVLFIVGLSI